MQGIRYYFNDVSGNIEIKKCNNSVHSNKAHFHNEVSIGLVEKGNCTTEICGKIYELKEKTILIIPAALAHKCNPCNYKQWNFRMLYINKDWFQRAFNNDKSEIKFSHIRVNEEAFMEIKRLFVDIEKGVMNIENESKLLNYISLLTNVDNKNLKKEIIKNINFRKINEIKNYLNENYLDNIMLNDLATMAEVSKYNLIRQFEKCNGLSPHKYITNLRINNAKKLLRKNKNFVEIALESGFYDQSHFTKCFKEYTGVTPLEYKSCV